MLRFLCDFRASVFLSLFPAKHKLGSAGACVETYRLGVMCVYVYTIISLYDLQ